MKNFTSKIKNASMVFFMIMATVAVNAQTYTAVSSGNWSQSSTWDGGNAPSFNIGLLDNVVIPSGISVTLDNTVIVDGLLANLTVDGSLITTGSGALILTSGTIGGDGVLDLDNTIYNGGTFSFTGDLMTNTMTVSSSLATSAEIVIHEKFTLAGGIFSILTNGLFELHQDGMIVINSGTMTLNGGGMSLMNAYDVMYSQGSSSSGFEMNGPGLRDLTIDVGQGNAVTFNSDVDVDGTLLLETGNMILNNNDLTVNGNLSSNGTGAIQSSQNSDITFNTSGGSNGTLRFSATGNSVDDFTINVGDGQWISLASNLNIHGTLMFNSGGLNAGNHNVVIQQSGSVSGADSSSYVMTDNGGVLSMYVSSGGSAYTVFHVGTSTNYMPTGLQLTGGSSSARMEVGVDDGVMSAGSSGNNWATDSAVVNSTWFIKPETGASNVETNIRFMWKESMEVNGFNRNHAYVAHYGSGSWNMVGSATAATQMDGMWTLVANNISDFSPFAIFDQEPMSISESDAQIAFDVYPNPTTERINIDFASDITGIINMEIVDAQGRVMNNYKLTGNETSISVDHLPTGNYFVRLFTNEFMTVKKIVKL